MRPEHRAPLVAALVVSIACGGVLVHAVRTDALGGLARPMRVIAAQLIDPVEEEQRVRPAETVALEPPVEPAAPLATSAPTASADTSAPSVPSAPTGRRPVRHHAAPRDPRPADHGIKVAQVRAVPEPSAPGPEVTPTSPVSAVPPVEVDPDRVRTYGYGWTRWHGRAFQHTRSQHTRFQHTGSYDGWSHRPDWGQGRGRDDDDDDHDHDYGYHHDGGWRDRRAW